MTATFITFGLYLVVLLGIGLYYYDKSHDISDFILGGRKLGKFVMALSAQASDMSGWLLMGLPGALYSSGMPALWIAVGLLIGTYCNWKFVAKRLRIYTEITDSITLPTFFEDRYKDPTGLLRIISALIILIFFTIYLSSGFVASGKLFESMLGIEYHIAVLIGAGIILFYTSLGGFFAVSITDVVQGLLMFFAVIVVPIVAMIHIGSFSNITLAMEKASLPVNPFSSVTLLSVLSTASWGLGYFGQPHILARFMGIHSHRDIKGAREIAMTWVTISLCGASFIGIAAVYLFPQLSPHNAEKVFIFMIQKFFTPWVGGILLAAILSAIMSTADSQLLVCSAALTEDFYQRVIKRNASQQELIHIGRLTTIIITCIAALFAMNPENTVLGLVAYAWGGFGAAFGPTVLFALFSKHTSWQSALGGMLAGTIALVSWKFLGLSNFCYEIVPGFIANVITILLLNKIYPLQNTEIDREFLKMHTILQQ
ncbi:MAG: sodium/proline symporter PutP [Spirochaetes bacterium]|nr:sodium/proline symporter PutP [Spirochaetota bacterium]